jgi:signal transduction histidine kinase/ActR/RegA family two-component response regulator
MADSASSAVEPQLPIERTLDTVASLLHAVIAGQRVDAGSVLENFPLPAAVFANSGSEVNAAWHAALGRDLPVSFSVALAKVRGTQVAELFPELEVELPAYTAYYAVAMQPLARGAIVTCAEVTDRVLAKQLGIGARDAAFTGLVPGNPSYYNQSWQTTIRDAWSEAVHPADVARANAALLEVTRKSETGPIEVRLRVGDEYRWHRMRFSRSTGGVIAGSAVDIHVEHEHESERAELLAQTRTALADAERANHLKDEFLTIVSHELRAPLTTMLLWERVLRENSLDAAARGQALDAIHHSAVAQARLIADLVDVARGITGKLYLDIRVVALEELLREACNAARPLALAKSIDLASKHAPPVGGIHGDAIRLRQILDNLLLYSLNSTPPGGKVAVSLVRRGRSVAVEIEDSGRGIAADILPRLFEPFGHVDDVLLRDTSALGLSIAKQLVDLHRGTLTVVSRGLDQGTKFTLTLPSAGNSRSPTPPVGARRAPRLDGARVLVVDDDARVCDALGLLLNRAGVAVDTADSAAMARTRIITSEPHVVICDIAMPGEDGYSFVRKLRADGWTFPAIALTAYATELDARRAVEAGFDVHIAKPISFERLVISLSELLNARRGELA